MERYLNVKEYLKGFRRKDMALQGCLTLVFFPQAAQLTEPMKSVHLRLRIFINTLGNIEENGLCGITGSH